MAQTVPTAPVSRNWHYFKTGLLGIVPLAIFGFLLIELFLQTNLFSISAFFQDTTATFNAVLYISLAVWIVVMAIANGRRLQRKRQRRPA